MKRKYLIDIIIAAVALVALLVWLIGFPPAGGDVPADPVGPTPTAPTDTTAPVDPDVPAGTLSFTGRVLEVEGDSALMKCLDTDRFDTVWVHLPDGVTPQVGEQYTVYHEDLVMPSLPPRVAALKMVLRYFEGTHPTTGEKWYDGLLYEMIDAYPWSSDDSDPAIPSHPEMGSHLYFDKNCTEIGYTLLDLDNDGQKELIIGGEDRPFPYDVFTIKDDQLTHLFSGHDRESYYLLKDGYIKKQWSGNAMLSGSDFYRLEDGKLQFIERITLDLDYARKSGLVGAEYTDGDEDKCFFRSVVYNAGDEQKGYVSITEQEAVQSIQAYGDQMAIIYQPLEELTYPKASLKEGECISDDYVYRNVDDGVEIVKHINSSAVHATVPTEIDGLPVVALGEDAFYQNKYLRTVKLPEGLKRIDGVCFYRCYSLQEIVIPSTVTEINSNPFWRASSLQKIEVADDNEAFQAVGGVLYDITGETLLAYPEGKDQESFTIPNETKTVRDDAFGYHPKLKKLYLTETVAVERFALTVYPTELTLYIYKDSPADRALQEMDGPQHPYEYR